MQKTKDERKDDDGGCVARGPQAPSGQPQVASSREPAELPGWFASVCHPAGFFTTPGGWAHGLTCKRHPWSLPTSAFQVHRPHAHTQCVCGAVYQRSDAPPLSAAEGGEAASPGRHQEAASQRDNGRVILSDSSSRASRDRADRDRADRARAAPRCQRRGRGQARSRRRRARRGTCP